MPLPPVRPAAAASDSTTPPDGRDDVHRALFERMHQGFCVVEVLVDAAGRPSDYRFVEANAAFATQTGLVDAVGRTARELVPDLEQHWVDVYGGVALSGEPVRFEQGSEAMGRWFEVHAYPVGAPGRRQVAILFSDTSERRRVELALRESEQRFREMADSAPVMIWVTDADGSCVFLNRPWYAYTAQTPRTGLGFGWLDAVHPEDRGGSERTFREASARQAPFRIEYRLRRTEADGSASWRWCIDAAAPRRAGDGRFVGYVGSVLDVHERREIEADRERLLAAERAAGERLAEADRRKDEFLATLAHELRNPLAPITNAVKLLEREPALSPPGQRGLRMIERQARQMRHLVDDLLEISRISRGVIQLRPEPIVLGSLVLSAVEAALPGADAKRQALRAHLPPTPVRLVADPVRIAQVLENLVGNAIKYTPAGGTIAVELVEDGDGAEIRVTDSGIGIAADQLASIFELFVQATPGLGEHQGGLGIGLALVKRLVEMHGGTVRAESGGRGQGSRFVVRLPKDPRIASTAPLAAPG